MRNYLIIAGKDSRDFGVYISGQGTFSAPEKAYQFYEVPGRNGAIIGNDHRLENIEVSYECFIYADFKQNIADFRTFLLSLDGYQRLTDSYHPDEFRMAVYTGPFEPEVTARNDAGSFTVTFNCKPQRWLISGETTYAWIAGGAHKVEGNTIEIYAPLADTTILDWGYKRHDVWYKKEWDEDAQKTVTIATIPAAETVNISIDGITQYETDVSAYNMTEGKIDLISGDVTLTAKRFALPTSGWQDYVDPLPIITKIRLPCNDADTILNCTDFLTAALGNETYITVVPGYLELRTHEFIGAVDFQNYLSNLGHTVYVDYTLTAPESYAAAITPYVPDYPVTGFFAISDAINNSSPYWKYVTLTGGQTASNNMSNPTIFPSSPMIRAYGVGSFSMDGVTITISQCTVYTDIDCDLMDCYEGTINRNNAVTFSTYDFPKLRPGDNAVNIISGITALEITPRWWRV